MVGLGGVVLGGGVDFGGVAFGGVGLGDGLGDGLGAGLGDGLVDCVVDVVIGCVALGDCVAGFCVGLGADGVKWNEVVGGGINCGRRGKESV